MKKPVWLALAVAFLAAAGFYAYEKWNAHDSSPRNELLAKMPSDASAVLYIDFDELRTAQFLAQLYAWAPKPQTDPEYAQFVKDTSFDFERDLHRVAIAFLKRESQDSAILAIGDGRFDKRKISAFALKTGALTKAGPREIFSVPTNENSKRMSFAFVRNDCIALTNGPNLAGLIDAKNSGGDAGEWRSRFERLAGSPIFAVIRQDAAAGSALASQAPGGLRSPQLSTLVDQLQWITIAAKPQADRLQVVAEGESATETTMRQLADVLNGVLILAEAGLNDAKMRQQLDPAARAAYLEVLKSTNVDKIDRGDSKAVRLSFEVTPAFLESARSLPQERPQATPKPSPRRAAPLKKGRT